MANKVVINASPLIFLARSGYLALLTVFADEVWVPEPVATEILFRGEYDVTAKAIKQTDWLITQPVSIPSQIMVWRLGLGESSVLALASQHNIEAIIDDLAGRKYAAKLQIPVRGTLGIILTAKQRGIIPKARPVIEDLMKTGLYLSKKVLDQALQRVGE